MNFFEYLDKTYQLKNLELQTMEAKQEFSLRLQAESRAVPDLINLQRSWFKFVGKIKLLLGFIICNLTGKYPELPKPLEKVNSESIVEIDIPQ